MYRVFQKIVKMTTNQRFDLATNHLLAYSLHLADNALVLGHRDSEWTGHGPILEQDIALSNIALDLIGQARNFYQYAAKLKADGSTEDTLAYLRDVNEFRNCLLVEQPNGDWGQTVTRQFLFSTYQYFLYQQLQHCSDKTIASIAEKGLKEVTYHTRWSSEWIIRLGDGTDDSHARMKNALDHLWEFTDELFIQSPYETAVAKHGIKIDHALIQQQWYERVRLVLSEATLPIPESRQQKRENLGKAGDHTQHLYEILSEMQSLQRALPGCEW
jgi:ring-1,2-phenylacetyl-CoA epoxidase subunit PaaC